jgi:hypothetical protein
LLKLGPLVLVLSSAEALYLCIPLVEAPNKTD